MNDATILVVDDETLLRELMKRLLERRGYRVIAVHSAEAATRVLADESIALALLDVSLPGRSGSDLLKSIVAEYPRTAVVMVTSVDSVESAVTCLRAGAYDYLTKPFADEPLELCVTRALERRELVLENRMYRERLERQISERTAALERTLDELNTTYDQTIRALGAALDLRDTETESHCARVAAYSVRIAQAMEIDDAKLLRNLKWGAYLHDIGKIGVPDAILLKPDSLTDAEFATMKQHPDLGSRMLEGIPFLRDASEVVRYHHEKLDGSGYPFGVAGEEIPLVARIFSVADAIDAMTSDRPYRAAMLWSEARGEIAVNSGSQFDPDVVDAFLTVSDVEWASIAATAPDREAVA